MNARRAANPDRASHSLHMLRLGLPSGAEGPLGPPRFLTRRLPNGSG